MNSTRPSSSQDPRSAVGSIRCNARNSLLFLAAGVALVLSVREVHARPTIRSSFFAAYPNAVGSTIDTVPSHPGHCGQCHFDFSGGGARNPYGNRLAQVLGNFGNNDAGRQQAMHSIENEDSDADGYSTLIEITNTITFSNTPTFSGLTPANVGSVLNVTVAEIQGHLVPSTGGDTTPPSVTVVTPNGGETYTANTAAIIQWTATDAGGIAAINIYMSEDNGVSYRPVALGLTNAGAHTWFPANRPTTTARIRVVAIDNAFNQGSDVSNAAFTIQSPPGGVVPTTLRDFDMPGTQPFGAGTINDPAGCKVCHGNYNPSVEPYFNWEGSMMAQASLDLLFEACLAVANQDAPDSGDLCLRCHLPKGWLGGRSVPTDGSQMLVSDEIGVSCDHCHRMVDPFYDPAANPLEDAAILAELDQVPINFANGMYVVDPNGTRRGPFVNATSGHAVLVSPFHREAGFCGTCHDVSNTAFTKDANGNYVPNPFNQSATNFSSHSLMPIERTYSEWFYSAYNTPQGVYAPQFGGNKLYVATCQDCHMRDVTGQGCNFGSPPTRTDLPLHDMTGGSTWLPGLLDAMYPGQVNDAALQAGIQRARYMLQNAASMSAGQAGATLNVTVTNETGHKLPTGYPEGRRMWINVKFYDGSQTLILESAAYDPATGVLAHDPQAQIYEAKPGLDSVTAPLVGVPEGPSFHFVLNNKIFKDNRIPPRGFANATFAQFGGAPVGASYTDGQYWDDVAYDIPAGAVSAVVTLYYQSTSKEYVEFLRDENTTNDRGQALFSLWNNNSKSPPELMRTATVPLSPPQACCLPNGTCQNLLAADCGSAGGESHAGAACTAQEACCLPGLSCMNADPVCCMADGGSPQGSGTSCGTTACPECIGDADCDDGLYCNGLETCDTSAGTCQAGTPQDCSDGVDCTIDACDEGTDSCTHVPDDNYCADELYCDGEETCDSLLGCRPGQYPCNDPALPTCDEVNDTCIACLVDRDCDDGLYCNGLETCNSSTGSCQPGMPPDCDDGITCTTDSCDEPTDSCVHIPEASLCDNGLFCDGEEYCDVSLGCQFGTPPCGDECEQCNEETDVCDWCMLDLDHNGVMGTGDFALFVPCFGGCYAPGDPCFASNFDGGTDGCVGTSDYAAFAGCFGYTCTQCPACSGAGTNLGLPARENGSSAPSVIIRLAVVAEASESDRAISPPKSVAGVAVGQTFRIEVWAVRSDARGPGESGLAAAYVDLAYEPRLLSVLGVESGGSFGLFPGSIAGIGFVQAAGGCASLGERSLGADGHWVRVATIIARAERSGTGTLIAGPSDGIHGLAVVGDPVNIDPGRIDFGTATLTIKSKRSPSRIGGAP